MRRTELSIYWLVSQSYNVLVTALEASTDVPRLAVVRERLFHEEAKMKSRISHDNQFQEEAKISFL